MAVVRESWGDGVHLPAREPKVLGLTRRDVLRAGLIAGATIAFEGSRGSARAQAAASTDAASPFGVYDMDQGWLFGGVYVTGSEAPTYSENGFSAVALPHTVTPLSWGDWDHTTWEQVWIYRRHIDGITAGDGRVFVDFQGIMTNATVYLNGSQVGEHEGGYLPFTVELTSAMTDGDNVLSVIVDSRWLDVPPDNYPKTASAIDYLQPGGIYRDVDLRVTPSVFISDVFAKPTNVLSSPAVEVQLTIDATTVPSDPAAISAEVLDGTTVVGSASGTVSVAATGETVANLSIAGLKAVGLWSPESPQLYVVNAIVTADGVSHSLAVTIGFREAVFQNDGFYLNGSLYKIFGLNRHQLFPYTGMAAPERLQRRDAELLRNELNCNMVRCSHYPQSPHFLDACDELGLMVWEEPPGWQYVGDAAFQAIVLQNVQDMVVRDRNRPSVIVWATRLNETSSTSNHALYLQTDQIAMEYDGTRQTTGAMSTQSTTDWTEEVFADDDYSSVGNDHTDAALNPPVSGVPYLVSEAVGALDGAPLYRWIDPEATLALQAKMHAQVHNIAQNPSATYAGLLGWCGIDYASLSGGNRIWNNIKWPGVLDTFRVPKPGAAFYRSQLSPSISPVILPVFFWDFGSQSPSGGPGLGAMIATNCDTLNVFIDDAQVVIGTPDASDYPYLAYPPVFVDLPSSSATSGDLRIDGYVEGAHVASVSMSSDTTKDQLALTVEDASIQGDGGDMTRFTFRALDAYGNQRPYVSGDVSLACSGPATLIAENPFSFETYGGVGSGFLRSQPGSSGTVTVVASHPSLGQATGTVTVTPFSGPEVASNPVTTVSAPNPPVTTVASSPSPTATASPTTTTGPPATTATKRVPEATVRIALAAVLSPRGALARIANLLHNDGYTFDFDAPSAGRLAIDWYITPRAARGVKRKPRPIHVASAVDPIQHTGRTRISLRLNARGRSLLKAAKQERLNVEARFTPLGQSTVTSTSRITLKRA